MHASLASSKRHQHLSRSVFAQEDGERVRTSMVLPPSPATNSLLLNNPIGKDSASLMLWPSGKVRDAWGTDMACFGVWWMGRKIEICEAVSVRETGEAAEEL